MKRNPLLQDIVLQSLLLGGLLTGMSYGRMAIAGEPTQASHAEAHAQASRASLHLEQNPFAKVYVVTSRATYDRVKSFARNGVARSDSMGNQLVVSEIRAHQLGVLTEDIHTNELRCGGYFAFGSRAEADAFIRNDRSAQAVNRSLLANYTIDNQATVNLWLRQVQAANIRNTIDHLQGYQNRYYSSATGKTSAEWIRNTWQGLANGRSDVSSELFACSDCSTQPSVILTVQGTDLPNEVVVLGGHLDSTSGFGGNGVTAPGADDDASGIATLTEVIRIAMANGWKPKRTVKFMGYAAEEVGLIGSNAIATSFKNAGVNVVGVLQLDMTNYQIGSATSMRLVSDYSNADLKTFFGQLFDTYLAPLGLSRGSYTCGYGCSDHASWTSAGYPSAMMFEAGSPGGGVNPNIHTPSDTLANMGDTAQPSVKFAQFGLAFLGELAKTQGGGSGTQTYTNGTDYAIPDNFQGGVRSKIVVSGRGGNGASSTPVKISIVHPYIGDLIVALVAPDGSVYNLHNRTGGSADNINKTVNVNLSGEALNGVWRLRVADRAAGNTGKIDSWTITF